MMELTELHERNNLNLAMCGGLESVITYILKHPDAECRAISCHLFSGVVQNNPEIQQFALRLGALNLMQQFVVEKEMRNKEAVIGALSSFLRAENFNSKRQFIGTMGGLQFLAQVLQEKEYSLRLKKKALILLNDLVLNDENIFDKDPSIVRKTCGEQMGILEKLLELFQQGMSDMGNGQMWDVRETILRIIFRVFQVCPQKLDAHAGVFA